MEIGVQIIKVRTADFQMTRSEHSRTICLMDYDLLISLT